VAAKLILQKVLKAQGMSKRQLAKNMGIEYRHVFAFFRPGFNPTLKTLERIAKGLGVKISDLIRD
jgi:transcriptional regulator with XRE-family HTH domain